MRVEAIDRSGRAAPFVAVTGRRGADAHHRGEHAIELEAAARAGQELLDLVEHRVLVADKRQMILAGQLDELRVRNQSGDIAPFFDLQAAIVGAVEDERRHADRRQHRQTSISAFICVRRSAAPGLAPMRR